MSISYDITHVETTTESVDVEVAQKTDMVLQSTFTDPKTGEITSTYVLANGDNSYQANVIYRNGLQTRQNAPIRRFSVTFTTWATSTDSVSGVVVHKPITGSMNFTIPADLTVETADMDAFIGNLVSYLYESVSAGARDTSWLEKLLFGIPQVS
jgi:hypothetical protein